MVVSRTGVIAAQVPPQIHELSLVPCAVRHSKRSLATATTTVRFGVSRNDADCADTALAHGLKCLLGKIQDPARFIDNRKVANMNLPISIKTRIPRHVIAKHVKDEPSHESNGQV